MAVTETGHAASLAIDDLYRRHGSDVYRYALAVLGNHADAEDVTQTTFLNAYRSLEQGVRPRKPANWLLTIASNAIKQRFRHDSARPRQVVLDDRLPDRGFDATESAGPTVGEILTALSHIPPQQRQAIVLREFEGRSYNEIAEILGVTTSALETLLSVLADRSPRSWSTSSLCTEAQFAISQAADGGSAARSGSAFVSTWTSAPIALGSRRSSSAPKALHGLVFVPIPVSLTLFKGLEGPPARRRPRRSGNCRCRGFRWRGGRGRSRRRCVRGRRRAQGRGGGHCGRRSGWGGYGRCRRGRAEAQEEASRPHPETRFAARTDRAAGCPRAG